MSNPLAAQSTRMVEDAPIVRESPSYRAEKSETAFDAQRAFKAIDPNSQPAANNIRAWGAYVLAYVFSIGKLPVSMHRVMARLMLYPTQNGFNDAAKAALEYIMEYYVDRSYADWFGKTGAVGDGRPFPADDVYVAVIREMANRQGKAPRVFAPQPLNGYPVNAGQYLPPTSFYYPTDIAQFLKKLSNDDKIALGLTVVSSAPATTTPPVSATPPAATTTTTPPKSKPDTSGSSKAIENLNAQVANLGNQLSALFAPKEDAAAADDNSGKAPQKPISGKTIGWIIVGSVAAVLLGVGVYFAVKK